MLPKNVTKTSAGGDTKKLTERQEILYYKIPQK